MRRIVLAILHLIVALFAFLGGWAAISQPTGPFGISTDMLAYSPFDTFLIPGLALFIVVGFSHLLAAILLLFRSRYQIYASFLSGGILVSWLIIQVIMIQTIEVLHVVTFVIGSIQVVASLVWIYRERLFPVEELTRLLQRRKHT